jgi:hypothetical protein
MDQCKNMASFDRALDADDAPGTYEILYVNSAVL